MCSTTETKTVPPRELCLRLAVDSLPGNIYPPITTDAILERADAFVAYLAGDKKSVPEMLSDYQGFYRQSGHLIDMQLGRCLGCGALRTTIDDGLAGDCLHRDTQHALDIDTFKCIKCGVDLRTTADDCPK